MKSIKTNPSVLAAQQIYTIMKTMSTRVNPLQNLKLKSFAVRKFWMDVDDEQVHAIHFIRHKELHTPNSFFYT